MRRTHNLPVTLRTAAVSRATFNPKGTCEGPRKPHKMDGPPAAHTQIPNTGCGAASTGLPGPRWGQCCYYPSQPGWLLPPTKASVRIALDRGPLLWQLGDLLCRHGWRREGRRHCRQ